MMSWSVVLPLPMGALDFAPPFGYTGESRGRRVVVPFRGELAVGLVVGTGGEAATREAVAVLDDAPWVSEQSLEAVGRWAAWAHVPLGLVWSDLLGVGWSPELGHEVRAMAGAELPEGVPLDLLREQGLLDEKVWEKKKMVVVLVPQEGDQPLTVKGRQAYECLCELGEAPSLSAWAEAAGVGAGVVTGVLNRGWARREEKLAPSPPLPLPPTLAPLPEKTDPVPHEKVWRLHGGRESARFLAISFRIREMLERGEGVLVLTPETRTLQEAWKRLGGLAEMAGTEAALLSGTVTGEQRRETWERIRAGRARLVIATSLGLAAPIVRLGLVIVLEEASEAYKLQSGSRVFVPDIVQHMTTERGLVGLVPAAESLSVTGVVFPAPPARVHVTDFSQIASQPELGAMSAAAWKPAGMRYPIGNDLARVLRQVQDRGRVAAVIAPRRGYSGLLRCPECEWVPRCQNCDLPLRFHKEKRRLLCHQCGYGEPLAERCERCAHPMWQTRGVGTEWVAEEIKKLLGDFPLFRYDSDRQDDLSPLRKDGASGVVVGTSALLGQPPLPVSLVAVALADTWLYQSDFRASERYHALLRRLSEWGGGALLVVQTFQPNHPALVAVVEGKDTATFVESELPLRRALGYPPASVMARITVSAKEAARAAELSEKVASGLFAAGATSAEVLGPAASVVARIRGVFPYHIMLRARDEERLGQLLEVVSRLRIRVRVEVNPRDWD